jgi:hypothetical protein
VARFWEGFPRRLADHDTGSPNCWKVEITRHPVALSDAVRGDQHQRQPLTRETTKPTLGGLLSGYRSTSNLVPMSLDGWHAHLEFRCCLSLCHAFSFELLHCFCGVCSHWTFTTILGRSRKSLPGPLSNAITLKVCILISMGIQAC